MRSDLFLARAHEHRKQVIESAHRIYSEHSYSLTLYFMNSIALGVKYSCLNMTTK